MYTCDKCKGTSTTSYVCENPSCPLMPCCGEEENNCSCSYNAVVDFGPLNLEKIFNTVNMNKGSFFIGIDSLLPPYVLHQVERRGLTLLNLELSN